ncbi:uncharacterized protein LOC106884119 [Octopus bimaculoides]|uniref:uncharacterized protein LOC106884119 n=1 Tax=Octopus bimaculoides TaxID=37653 RepID=UPI00071D7E05|nr:uncharacterized protein LOC106884119 [Octopus bimaculoides]|eukprot:XP_014790827.1 PREDICTED: uncharacterized protein LOC106884119 [Octopus bimaculoides]
MATANSNLSSLMEKLKTEEDVVSYLQEKGIIPKRKLCANKHYMRKKMVHGKVYWRCSQKGCCVCISVRRGTWLEGRTLPLRTVVLFLYSWSKELTSVHFCVEELGMKHSTIVDYNSYVREICAEDLLRHPVQIGGPGKTVDLDKIVFSRGKCNRRSLLPEQWVFGGVCRETKDVFLYAASCLNRDTLEECIRQSILPGTTIFSDIWESYSPILKIDDYALRYRTVNHSVEFVNSEGSTHMKLVENTRIPLKRGRKQRCGTKSSTIDLYLCEFMWRKRYENCNLFEKLLECISSFCF